LLDVPSIGEFLVVFVRQLVGARLEHFDNDVGSLPWGAIACGGLDCLGAVLRLDPLCRSIGAVFSGLGTTSVPAGSLLSASGPRCGPHPIDLVSPRGIAS
jgi:hypothetical protein